MKGWERRLIHREAAEQLFNDFCENPHANKPEVIGFGKSWEKDLPEDSRLKYKDRLLVKIEDVNNDQLVDYPETKLLIYPSQKVNNSKLSEYSQPMTRESLNSIEKGNFLVLYWVIEYKGQARKFFIGPYKTYSTSYVGYYPGSIKRIIGPDGQNYLQDFRSWTGRIKALQKCANRPSLKRSCYGRKTSKENN